MQERAESIHKELNTVMKTVVSEPWYSLRSINGANTDSDFNQNWRQLNPLYRFKIKM